jgi:hypothetical protein
LSISCSSILWRDGLRWLVSMKLFTWVYFMFHLCSWVISKIENWKLIIDK